MCVGVLFYHCRGGCIIAAWGMADAIDLASNPALALADVMRSPAWPLCQNIIAKVLCDSSGGFGGGDLVETHFHDYDNLEVWG